MSRLKRKTWARAWLAGAGMSAAVLLMVSGMSWSEPVSAAPPVESGRSLSAQALTQVRAAGAVVLKARRHRRAQVLSAPLLKTLQAVRRALMTERAALARVVRPAQLNRQPLSSSAAIAAASTEEASIAATAAAAPELSATANDSQGSGVALERLVARIDALQAQAHSREQHWRQAGERRRTRVAARRVAQIKALKMAVLELRQQPPAARLEQLNRLIARTGLRRWRRVPPAAAPGNAVGQVSAVTAASAPALKPDVPLTLAVTHQPARPERQPGVRLSLEPPVSASPSLSARRHHRPAIRVQP